jgi:hypothetical protein
MSGKLHTSKCVDNGAACLIGASYSEQPDARQSSKQQLVDVFRRKVDQAVEEVAPTGARRDSKSS